MPKAQYPPGRKLITDPRQGRPAEGPLHAGGRPDAEAVLRELAFVLHLSRTVREAITDAAALAD